MKKTQCDRVLEFMKTHKCITTIDANQMYITRLASRIWDLKHKYGARIKKEMVTYRNENNEAVTVAAYSLAEEA